MVQEITRQKLEFGEKSAKHFSNNIYLTSQSNSNEIEDIKIL